MLHLDRHDHQRQRRQHDGPAPEIELPALNGSHELGIRQPDRQRAEQFGTALAGQRQQRQRGQKERADPGKLKRQPVGDIACGQRKRDEQRADLGKARDLAGCDAGKECVHNPNHAPARFKERFPPLVNAAQRTCSGTGRLKRPSS